MEINQYSFDEEGLGKIYDNGSWIVGIKNWKPANDISSISNLERHNKTDEMFVLLSGECSLIYADENDGNNEIKIMPMEMGKVYCIPKKLWHNTIMKKETKMILIEAPNTSMENSDILLLSEEQQLYLSSYVK